MKHTKKMNKKYMKMDNHDEKRIPKKYYVQQKSQKKFKTNDQRPHTA